MRLVFLVHRSNYYKLYGPIIESAIERRLDVELWLLQNESGSKAHLMPSAEKVPDFGQDPIVRTFLTKADLDLAIEHSAETTFISLHPKVNYINRALPPFFITIQHGIDTFVESSLDVLSSSDVLCLYSEFWLDWAARYYSEVEGVSQESAKQRLLKNAHFTGFPQMDAVSKIDPLAVRRRLQIEPGRPVVLLLPITLSNKAGAWPRFFEVSDRRRQFARLARGAASEGAGFGFEYLPWALKGWNDEKLTSAVREFCDRNNAFLVVKGRAKDPVRSWLSEAADVVCGDEGEYPPTTLELLSIADVCIHFYSFAALEAAYMGVYGITIDRPSPAGAYNESEPTYHRLWRTHDNASAFNFAGVNKWMTIPQAFESLADLKVSQLKIDKKEHSSYIATYLGNARSDSSKNVLSLVQEGALAK